LASGLSFAGDWTGALVDSNCYAHLKSNVSQDAGHTGTDRRRAIKVCSASATTKSLGILERHGSLFDLDATGQESAISEVLKDSKAPHVVHVTGDLNQKTIKVTGISKAQ
jgi:hypothetical protein